MFFCEYLLFRVEKTCDLPFFSFFLANEKKQHVSTCLMCFFINVEVALFFFVDPDFVYVFLLKPIVVVFMFFC